MIKIVILEPDSLTRDALRAALAGENLAEECAVEECARAEAGENSVRYLWTGPRENIPESIEIREEDVFRRPLRLGEILDRVKRHLASSQNENMQAMKFGDYEIDGAAGALRNSRTGRTIRLTEKERHILEFLVLHKGETVDRQALLRAVWGYAEGLETHTIETHIYRLRQKIEKDPARPEILLTESSGYRISI